MNYESDDEKIESEDWNRAKELNEEEFYKANAINNEETHEPQSNKKNNTEENDSKASISKKDIEDFNSEEFQKNKLKDIIGLVLLTALLFVFGIAIGRKMLLVDEKPVTYKAPRNVAEKNISNKTETNVVEGDAIDVEKTEVADGTEQEQEVEDLIVYARYKIQDGNDDNKDCKVTFGKESNFSFDLGKDGAFIFGNYHIDGDIITCNAITWRNQEKVEAINSTLKFKIIEKNLVQISEVTIYDGNEGLDQELINLDGLKVGMQYKYEKKVGNSK